MHTAHDAMWKGIDAVRPGATLGDVGHAIERHARGNGYSIVRQYCGRGIGREMHEAREVLHWGKPGADVASRRKAAALSGGLVSVARRARSMQTDGHAMERNTPPSTRNAAPVVADACSEAT